MQQLVFNFKHANELGMKLVVHDGADLVFQKLILDTGSYAKSVRIMRETYRIGVTIRIV